MSTHRKQILSTTLIYSAGTLLTQFVSFLLLPLYTRYLGPTDYGALSLLMAAQLLLVLFAELGIISALFRFYHEYESERDRRRLLATALVSVLCTGGVIFGVVQLFAAPIAQLAFPFADGESLLRIAALTGLCLPLCTFLLRTHQLAQRPYLFVATSVAQFTITIITTVFLVVVAQWGIRGVIVGQLAGAGTIAIISLISRGGCLTAGIDSQMWRKMLRFSLPLVPTSMASMVIALSDRFFLEKMSTMEEVGLYAVADKMTYVLMVLLVVPFNQSWNQFAYSHQKDPELKQTYSTTFRFYTVGMMTLIVCFAFVIHELLLIATTPEFAAAYRVVPLLCLAPLAQGYVNFLGTGIHLANKTAIIPFIWLFAMGVNLILNYLLIPHYGMVGAAVATAIAVLTNAALYLVASRHYFPVAYPLRSAMAVLVSGVLALGIYTIYDPPEWHLSIALRICCLIGFLGLLLLSRAVTPSEVREGYRAGKAMLMRLWPWSTRSA